MRGVRYACRKGRIAAHSPVRARCRWKYRLAPHAPGPCNPATCTFPAPHGFLVALSSHWRLTKQNLAIGRSRKCSSRRPKVHAAKRSAPLLGAGYSSSPSSSCGNRNPMGLRFTPVPMHGAQCQRPLARQAGHLQAVDEFRQEMGVVGSALSMCMPFGHPCMAAV